MTRPSTHYVCQGCGAASPKWLGQCPGCEEWGTLVEEPLPVHQASVGGIRLKPRTSGAAAPMSLAELEASGKDEIRLSTMPEFDRILGGGLTVGSVVLIGGPPGVGKSTLVLEVAQGFGASGKSGKGVLYVSAEESPAQVAARAKRIGVSGDALDVIAETEMDAILDLIELNRKYGLIIVDSIQTVRLASLMSAAGTVAQVRECAAKITEWAKSSGAVVVLVGHVTKDGQIAGPKVLEHIVDVVCYLDEEAAYDMRVLRTTKNRYGAVGEIGLFEMTGGGLKAVSDEDLPWIGKNLLATPAIFGVINSASRSWLCEVQALVTPTAFQYPRRIAVGVEINRLGMLLAVIEKHLKVPISTRDVHVNVVGGLRVLDPALDLAVAIAVLTSYAERPVDTPIAAIGEVGLGGEVRRTSRQQYRIAEAQRFGIEAIMAGGNEPSKTGGLATVTSLTQVLAELFGGGSDFME